MAFIGYKKSYTILKHEEIILLWVSCYFFYYHTQAIISLDIKQNSKKI